MSHTPFLIPFYFFSGENICTLFLNDISFVDGEHTYPRNAQLPCLMSYLVFCAVIEYTAHTLTLRLWVNFFFQIFDAIQLKSAVFLNLDNATLAAEDFRIK